jgi:CRISPR-associated protein Csm5
VASLDTRQSNKPQLVWKVAGRGSVPPQRLSDATPVFAEMAVPGTTFSGEWHDRTFLQNEELMRALNWKSVPEPKQMVEAARQHTAAQLELQERYAEMTGLEAVQREVQVLKRELEAVHESPGTCVLCLGWGSGFVSKTGFLQTEQESYRKILRTIPAFGKALREGVPFPKTRRIVFGDGRPWTLPGWVKLQLED